MLITPSDRSSLAWVEVKRTMYIKTILGPQSASHGWHCLLSVSSNWIKNGFVSLRAYLIFSDLVASKLNPLGLQGSLSRRVTCTICTCRRLILWPLIPVLLHLLLGSLQRTYSFADLITLGEKNQVKRIQTPFKRWNIPPSFSLFPLLPAATNDWRVRACTCMQPYATVTFWNERFTRAPALDVYCVTVLFPPHHNHQQLSIRRTLWNDHHVKSESKSERQCAYISFYRWFLKLDSAWEFWDVVDKESCGAIVIDRLRTGVSNIKT